MKQKIIVIAGPTGSGKSALAIEIAEKLNGEIVCADSLTVYRRLDIGSAKPTREQQARVKHHLLNIREPLEPFTAADFNREASRAIESIAAKGKKPIIAGGTGLYIKTLLGGLMDAPGENLEIRNDLRALAEKSGPEAIYEKLKAVDPATAEKLHPGNLVRTIRALEVYLATGKPLSMLQKQHAFAEKRFDALQICLDLQREQLYSRIEARVDQMFEDGLLDEVKGLLADGLSPDLKPLGAIGYREIIGFIRGEYDLEEAKRLIKLNTRHYAKRQLTWFRREAEMLWIAYPEKSANIANYCFMHFEDGGNPHVQGPL